MVLQNTAGDWTILSVATQTAEAQRHPASIRSLEAKCSTKTSFCVCVFLGSQHGANKLFISGCGQFFFFSLIQKRLAEKGEETNKLYNPHLGLRSYVYHHGLLFIYLFILVPALRIWRLDITVSWITQKRDLGSLLKIASIFSTPDG